MSELEYRKKYTEYQKEYIKYLQRWNWEWAVHMYAEKLSTIQLEKKFQTWCRELGHTEHLYICAMALQNYQHTNHLHGLVLGGNVDNSKSLLNVDPEIWQNRWCQNAMIKTVHVNSIQYMVLKNTPQDFHVWLHEIGIKKLKQLQLHKLNNNI